MDTLPNRKVTVMVLGGSFAAVFAWIIEEFTAHTIPPGVAAELAVIFGAILGYFVPEKGAPGPTPPALFILFACMALLMVGCSGARALYSQADTPEEKALAVLEHHNALGEAAAEMYEDPTVSLDVKAAIRDAYRVTVCSEVELEMEDSTSSCEQGAAPELERAVHAYQTLTDGAPTDAELTQVTAYLTALMVRLVNLVEGE